MGCVSSTSHLPTSTSIKGLSYLQSINISESEIDPFKNQLVFGQKQLHQINNQQIKELLHACTGAIIFNHYTNRQPGKGTGFLISPNLVLTVAHNLYDRENGKYYSNFLFYPGQNGTLEDPYKVQNIYFPQQYKTSTGMASLAFDYALLKLKEPVNIDGYLELATNYRSLLDPIGIWGYPADAYSPVSNQANHYQTFQRGLTLQNCITNINLKEKYIYYELSTNPGHSGSAIVLASERQKNLVIGIHKGGNRQLNLNAGRLITQDLIQNLMEWANNCKGTLFKWRKIDHRLGQRKYQWDINSPHSQDFSIENAQIKKIVPFDPNKWNCYHHVSLHPLPNNTSYTIIFKVKYACNDSIFYLGLVTQSLKWKDKSRTAYQADSVAYLTKKQGKQGYIYANGQRSFGSSGQGISQIFIQQQGKIKMKVNLSAGEIIFDNLRGKTWKIQIGKNFKNKQIYVFASMKHKNDCVSIELSQC